MSPKSAAAQHAATSRGSNGERNRAGPSNHGLGRKKRKASIAQRVAERRRKNEAKAELRNRKQPCRIQRKLNLQARIMDQVADLPPISIEETTKLYKLQHQNSTPSLEATTFFVGWNIFGGAYNLKNRLRPNPEAWLKEELRLKKHDKFIHVTGEHTTICRLIKYLKNGCFTSAAMRWKYFPNDIVAINNTIGVEHKSESSELAQKQIPHFCQQGLMQNIVDCMEGETFKHNQITNQSLLDQLLITEASQVEMCPDIWLLLYGEAPSDQNDPSKSFHDLGIRCIRIRNLTIHRFILTPTYIANCAIVAIELSHSYRKLRGENVLITTTPVEQNLLQLYNLMGTWKTRITERHNAAYERLCALYCTFQNRHELTGADQAKVITLESIILEELENDKKVWGKALKKHSHNLFEGEPVGQFSWPRREPLLTHVRGMEPIPAIQLISTLNGKLRAELGAAIETDEKVNNKGNEGDNDEEGVEGVEGEEDDEETRIKTEET